MAEYPKWFLEAPFGPPEADVGEPSRDPLYALVGQICHRWEWLEGMMLDLYLRLMQRAHIGGPINLGAYTAVFGAVDSSATRRDIVQALGEAIFMRGTPDNKEIQRVTDLHGRAVGFRNKAAHGIVIGYNHQGYFVMPPPYRPLLPPWNKKGEWIEEDYTAFKYRYDTEALKGVLAVFSKLESEFDSLLTPLGGRLTTFV